MQSKPRYKLGLDGTYTPVKQPRPPKAPKPISELRRLIGQRVADERVRLGYTQVQLAEKLGMTRRGLAFWEGGYSTPNAEDLAQMLPLGFDIAFVLTGWRAYARAA
jgi:DNA-binding XRE family transcriptional regulator